MKTITESEEKDRHNKQLFLKKKNNNLAASFIREANSSTNLFGVESSLSSDSNASSNKMCAKIIKIVELYLKKILVLLISITITVKT